jgi:hypothetical protein
MAPPPSSDTIVAAVAALRADAGQWRRCAATLTAAGGVAADLRLGTFELSYFSEKTGLVEVYGRLQAKMAQLCAEAGENFAGFGYALDSAATGYERDEREAVHRLRGAW